MSLQNINRGGDTKLKKLIKLKKSMKDYFWIIVILALTLPCSQGNTP